MYILVHAIYVRIYLLEISLKRIVEHEFHPVAKNKAILSGYINYRKQEDTTGMKVCNYLSARVFNF